MSLLNGKLVSLRTVRQTDLEVLYEHHHDVANRGPFFPIGVKAEPLFRSAFASTGFWGEDEGMLLITTASGELAGHIEFFRTVSYLDELELSYQIYSPTHAGKGLATEAVKLLTGYLFDRKKYNRIRLIIHPDNAASRRIAEKCGYVHEGTARGAWYHRGRSHDVEVYALLRAEHEGSAREGSR